MTLKQKTYSAVRWTTAAALCRALLQVAQVSVLARLLSAEEYGQMAMVGVVLSFAGLFADIGVNSGFVLRREVTQEQRSSLFWLNVAMSAGVFLLVIVASPLLASLFCDERLIPLMILSASTVVIGALGLQVRTAAEKELRFRPVVLLEIAAAFTGFVAALIAASLGWGVYSLVLSGVISAVLGTVFAWVFIANGWRPMLRFRLVDVRPFLGFGGALVANNLVNQINITIDLLLGGRLLGAGQLGLYSVPRNLVLQIQFMVNPIITRVGFPLIAQVQTDVARVRSIYLKTLNMTASTNAPLYVGIAFFAPEIVVTLLGDGWQGSIPLLRILAIWGLVRSIANPVGSLLFGMGRADLALKWNLSLLFILTPVLWVGSQYGSNGLAWALLGFSTLIFVPGWYILVRPLCGATLDEYSIEICRPIIISLASGFVGFTSVYYISIPAVRLLVGLIVAGIGYLSMSYHFNRYWLNSMRELVPRINQHD